MKKLLLLFILLPIICHASIYQKKNDDGSMTFSDQHIDGSSKVYIDNDTSGRVTVTEEKKVSPLQKIREKFLGLTSDEKSHAAIDQTDQKVTQYNKLMIANPSNEQSFWNQPSIGVMVQSEPALTQGHKIQLYLDGARFDKPKAGNKFSLNNLSRGEHSVKATIIDENGQSIIESQSVLFFVHRSSVKETKVGTNDGGNIFSS